MVNPAHLTKLDLLDRFRHYMLQHLKSRGDEAQEVGFYQFTEATDDEKLIAFVESFGPFWGHVAQREMSDVFRSQKLTVRQNLPRLRKEQARFAAAVHLLRELNRNQRPRNMGAAWKEMITAMMTIYPVPLAYIPKKGVPPDIRTLAEPTRRGTPLSDNQPWIWSYLTVAELANGHTEGRAQRILQCAHRTLCNLLNEVPLMLVPADGHRPVEMPRLAPEGIAGALYFKLRLDYLAGREIKTCLYCGSHFPVERRGKRWCSERCGRAGKNLKYWGENGEQINRKRRQHPGEKAAQR
jgi:hypothetical protein